MHDASFYQGRQTDIFKRVEVFRVFATVRYAGVFVFLVIISLPRIDLQRARSRARLKHRLTPFVVSVFCCPAARPPAANLCSIYPSGLPAPMPAVIIESIKSLWRQLLRLSSR